MKNSVDITRKYQFLYMLGRHFAAVLICFVIEAVAFYGFFSGSLAKYIVSGVFTLVYGGIIYSAASKLAGFDAKPYTPLETDIRWGIMWGVMISALIALFIAIFKINWAVNNSQESGIILLIINILFYIISAPFWGFIGSAGAVPVWAAAIMIIVPIAACAIGYYAGAKNFDLINKIDSMTFENSDDDE